MSYHLYSIVLALIIKNDKIQSWICMGIWAFLYVLVGAIWHYVSECKMCLSFQPEGPPLWITSFKKN